MKRDSFVYYRSFYELTKELPKEVAWEVDNAIKEYALNGVEPTNLKPMAKAVFGTFKPQIDANTKRYLNGCKGGAPKGNHNAKKSGEAEVISGDENNLKTTKKQPRNNQETTKVQPKNNQKQPKNNQSITKNNQKQPNDYNSNTIIEDGNNGENTENAIYINNNINNRLEDNLFSDILPPPPPPTPEPEKPKRFVKPSIEEVEAYIKEKGYSFSAERFVAYYESNGWKVGKNKMVSWKQACVTWHLQNEPTGKATTETASRNKRYKKYEQ